MTTSEIKELIHANPFYPFDLKLNDGTQFRVESPDHAAVNPFTGTIYLFAPGAVYRIAIGNVTFARGNE